METDHLEALARGGRVREDWTGKIWLGIWTCGRLL